MRGDGQDRGEEHSPDRAQQPLDEVERTLAEREQTLSDSDRTLSDRDPTASDRDQEASDSDQAAADQALEEGGDAASHAHGTEAWAEATPCERHEAGRLRAPTTSQRDRVARERDADAAARDAAADADAAEQDEIERARAHEGRRHGAAARARAARDRALSARDRELSTRDRELSARERAQAGTDELTGASRRGVGLEALQREIDRARRTGEPLVAAFVDVDGLKTVNDNYGHFAGDALLRDVVDALRSRMRSYDLIVRLGGDEFLCALPAGTVKDAQRRFEDLNSELSAGPTARSVSVGFTELRDGDTLEDVIDRADRALLAIRAR